MDNLSTCMICEEEFEEAEGDKKAQNVVDVYDATYEGQEEGMGKFELHADWGSPVERAVYCNECWATLVVYSWELVKERKGAMAKWIQ